MNSTSEKVLQLANLAFGWEDYVLFLLMLGVSAAIGLYFGFCAKVENTPEEYLHGGKKMKSIPIAISLVASQLSALSVMAIPTEIYSFGVEYSLVVLSMIVTLPLMISVIIPVFHNNNLTNCYEYLELRFDKKTRQLVTVFYLLMLYILLPILIFLPSIAFAQVTGINIHIINTVINSICIFYTMLGGIKAVVWTDVVQGGIMLFSIILVACFGVYNVGGVSEVWTRSWAGGRINSIKFTFDLTTRTTFWNCFISGILMWICYIPLNQSCVQRLVSLPTLRDIKKSLVLFAIGYFIIMFFICCSGIVMFARYHECDPVKAGIISKPDKIMPFFVQDTVGHLKGMPGVFVSCVFSAALSTMSANLNSLAGIVYFDYIKPFVKHTERRANFIMKCFVIVTGIYCIIAGFIVEQFTSILQVILTLSGITQGGVVGVYFLGLFYPRATAKAAFSATLLTMIIMAWVVIGTQKNLRSGKLRYDPLPTRIDQCDAYNISTPQYSAFVTNATVIPEEQDHAFSFHKIAFNWYGAIGVVLTCIIGILISHIPSKDTKDLNPSLIAPVAHFLIPKKMRHIKVPLEESNK